MSMPSAWVIVGLAVSIIALALLVELAPFMGALFMYYLKNFLSLGFRVG